MSRFATARPCEGCPFTRGDKAVRLLSARVEELCDGVLGGESFPCHKTTTHDDNDEWSNRGATIECAGAILFGFKQNGYLGQMARIAERLGMFNVDELQGADDVFDSTDEMMETACDS